ncbi:Methyltransferase type 11 [Kribbella flavida DSM 17836]|uniref:Methyltransferase type 11 n=1 Tax=Kribbella flavida (strain DSM 17836 / JCM 10339 / NBRC 14399) TaxID=479435 RepID=D2PTN4_KRIFD|nr:class I SAM-dependent methyltransferase [Kribbella flavida]ADB31347.1 Methyltransferase type 11 [Kribbella flavida DSM 17836]
MDRTIRTIDDVLELLDTLLPPEANRWTTDGASWWDAFYADRDRPIPFFVAKPDENLVGYLSRGLVTPTRPQSDAEVALDRTPSSAPEQRDAAAPARALDLGCGPGRNALHLAAAGFEVDAVDLSPTAIAWGEDRARDAGATITFHCGDAFALPNDQLTGPYDLIYDSGCFHHLPPHRRISYLALLDRVLAPGGHLALTTFAAGRMGSELDDVDYYRQSQLHGGLAYTPDNLRWIFSDLTERELRPMHDESPTSPYFGEPFLLTALFRRDQR